MSPSPISKEVQSLFDSLKIVRKGNEDDFEVRSSADGLIWGVRAFSDSPSKSTLILYSGPEAKELACDVADYDLEEDEDDSDEDDLDADDDDEDDED